MNKDKRKNLSPILGNELKRLRKNKDYTQLEVAANIGVSQVAIGHYEKGQRMPSTEVVKALAQFFKVSSEELLELRKMAIFETVMLLGDDAPLAIKNERNMIAHGYDPETRLHRYDLINQGIVEPSVVRESDKSEANLILKLVIHKDGSLTVDGQKMLPEDLPEYLKVISKNNEQ